MPFIYDREEKRIRELDARDFKDGERCGSCRNYVQVRPTMRPHVDNGFCLVDELWHLSVQACLCYKRI